MTYTTKAAAVVAGSLIALGAAVAPAQAAAPSSAPTDTQPVPANTLPAPVDHLGNPDLSALTSVLQQLLPGLPV